MDNWKEENNTLTNTYYFTDFVQAFAFMTEVAIRAEKIDHHPLWTNVYNKVSFSLQTHDAGNTVTEKDRDLANYISQVYQKYAKD